MWSNGKIHWSAFVFFISVAGYYLAKEKTGNDALKVGMAPTETIQPTQVIENQNHPVDKVNQVREIEIQHQAGIQVQILQEKRSLDKSTLPSGFPSEEAFLNADDTWVFVGDVNAVQVNHGDTFDPDIENYPQTSSMGAVLIEDIGEHLDPEKKMPSIVPEAIMTPQHIGPHIDPDIEKAQIVVPDTMEKVINIGEHLDPDLQPIK